jgi:hypothetical protein
MTFLEFCSLFNMPFQKGILFLERNTFFIECKFFELHIEYMQPNYVYVMNSYLNFLIK